jgi:hypothetical protein
MIQTRPIAVVLLVAIATIGTIGIGIATGAQSAQADQNCHGFAGNSCGNDNFQSNDNVQGTDNTGVNSQHR